MLQERRRFVRTNSRVNVNYTVLPSGTTKQTVSRDIAVAGMRLILDRSLTPGTQLQLAVILPEQGGSVNCIAEVVNNEQQQTIDKAGQRSVISVGTRFVEIAPNDQQMLTRHIATHVRAQQAYL